MPVLPDISARRSAPQSRRGVVSDPTAGMVADTVSGVAKQAQSVVNQIQQQQDDLSYAQAKADMVVADIDARAELENDTDHATHGERYAKAMDTARTKATSQIGNKLDRARFEDEDKLFKARGNELVNKRVRSLARDERRAATATSLESLRDGALVDTSEGTDFLVTKTARDLIDTGVAAGDFGFDEGRQIKETWGEGYAVAKIEMLPLADQIVALQSEGTIADEIDPDIRNDMLNTARSATKTEVTKQASQMAADEIYEADLTYAEQLKLAREIEVASIRDATVKRLKDRHAEDKVIAEEHRVTNLEEAYGAIDAPGGTMDDIPSDAWAQLPAKDRHAVEKYARNPNVVTDMERWYKRNNLKQSDPVEFAALNLIDDKSFLSPEDLRGFADDQVKIRDEDPSVDSYSLRTDKQAVDSAALAIGLDPTPGDSKKKAAAMGEWNWRFTQEVNRFKSQNKGREPNAQERNDILGTMAIEVVTNVRPIIWDVKARSFEIAGVEGVPDEEISTIVARLREHDLAATEENIQEGWRRIQNER